jgi:hypothetical protein
MRILIRMWSRMRIRMRILASYERLKALRKLGSYSKHLACHLQIDADPDPVPAYHFYADTDPAYHFNAYPQHW